MARGVPVNQAVRARILKLHADGITRNDIARLTGVSTGVVSRIVKAAGGTFQRASATKEATEARAADFADIRARIAVEMSLVAFQETKRAREPYVVYAFGGAENEYNWHELDLPPAAEVQKMQSTAGMAFDKASKMIESTEDADGLAPVESMLGRLAQRFGLVESDDTVA